MFRIQTAEKERFHMYCATVYARSGVNQMWILRNSKELLENLKGNGNGLQFFYILKITAK
jgi:hypothetical protein